MQAFSRAAEGIRTLDLLHGKQSVWFLVDAHIPCKRRGRFSGVIIALRFPGFYREFTRVWVVNR